jgi:hypothetical protein
MSINDADQSAGPSVSEALALFNKLSRRQRAAALAMLEGLAAGQSFRKSGITFLTTCGADAGEAEGVISRIHTDLHGAVK